MTHDAAVRAAAVLHEHVAAADSSVLLVDRARLAANVAAVRNVLGRRYLWAVVKADAYGLGAVPVARTLLDAGADALAVARGEEYLALRAAGIVAPVLILGPLPASVPDDPALHVTLTCTEDLERAAALPPAVRIHIKIDTGMGRLGLPYDPAQWLPAARALGQRWVGLWSHYANADTPADPYNDVQQARFHAAVDAVRASGIELEHLHLANSAGLLRVHNARETGARVGLYLYGGDPWGTATALAPPQAVVEWIAPLKSLRDVPAGWPLSYRGLYAPPVPTRVGVVPVGYADGLPTHTRDAKLWCNGQRLPIRGRITMDLSIVELGAGWDGARAVYVLGPHGACDAIGIADWCAWTGRIPYEVLTAIGSRVRRVYV